MATHVRVLGWLNIVMAVMNLVAGFIVVVVMGGVAVAMHGAATTVGSSAPNAQQVPTSVFTMIAFVVAIIMLIAALPGLITGIGLLRFRPWARILGIVLAVLHVLNFPLGTALAVYSFVILLNPETAALFESGGYGTGTYA